MNLSSKWIAAAAAVMFAGCASAALPSDWQREQSFTMPASGLSKISLPVETLDAARPGLEDLRLYDDAGHEIPYLIERPMPVTRTIREVKSFSVAMQARATVITIQTGLTQPLDTVTLDSPAATFLKAVRVEGSADRNHWQSLVQGQPIFRLSSGASRLNVAFPSGTWEWLRLTLDDERTPPIPVTAAHVQATLTELAPSEWFTASISERTENPGQTRVALDLGAANLNIVSVQFATAEPLFTRPVTLAVPQVSEDAVREQTVGQGTIYKVAIEGQPASENLAVPLNKQIRSQELLALIQNGDSPALPIFSVRIERRPVYLVFLARQPGMFHLLTGNSRCVAPRYDLSGLQIDLKSIAVASARISPPQENPNYRAPEALAGIDAGGTALDVADWKFRKPVKLARNGAQQLEPDLEILSRARSGLTDLRLVRDGKQIPYITEHTSITRAVKPEVTATTDEKDKTLSRWILKLSRPNLPLTRLQCTARTALFERDVQLYEELTDERGEKYRHSLGSATWIRTPDQSRREFLLTFNSAPEGDTLILETRNGDNPLIELEDFRLFHPVTRVLFKANTADGLFVYYGNPGASAPRYDLSLVTDQLLSADRSAASPGAEEQLKKTSWAETHKPGTGGIVFWGILALVVVGLLLVIAKLLPKSQSP